MFISNIIIEDKYKNSLDPNNFSIENKNSFNLNIMEIQTVEQIFILII